jgi:serine protease Do
MKKLLPVFIMFMPLLLFAEQTTIGYLGVLSEPISETMLKTLDLEHGVLVTKVYEDTPADEAGLKVGDVIYEIDGEKITEIKILKDVVAERPLKKVEIKFFRSGSRMKETVKLGEKEKEIIKFNIQMPDMEDFKETFESGREEFKEQLENIKQEIEQLKKEIEDIKRQMQEQ